MSNRGVGNACADRVAVAHAEVSYFTRLAWRWLWKAALRQSASRL